MLPLLLLLACPGGPDRDPRGSSVTDPPEDAPVAATSGVLRQEGRQRYVFDAAEARCRLTRLAAARAPTLAPGLAAVGATEDEQRAWVSHLEALAGEACTNPSVKLGWLPAAQSLEAVLEGVDARNRTLFLPDPDTQHVIDQYNAVRMAKEWRQLTTAALTRALGARCGWTSADALLDLDGEGFDAKLGAEGCAAEGLGAGGALGGLGDGLRSCVADFRAAATSGNDCSSPLAMTPPPPQGFTEEATFPPGEWEIALGSYATSADGEPLLVWEYFGEDGALAGLEVVAEATGKVTEEVIVEGQAKEGGEDSDPKDEAEVGKEVAAAAGASDNMKGKDGAGPLSKSAAASALVDHALQGQQKDDPKSSGGGSSDEDPKQPEGASQKYCPAFGHAGLLQQTYIVDQVQTNGLGWPGQSGLQGPPTMLDAFNSCLCQAASPASGQGPVSVPELGSCPSEDDQDRITCATLGLDPDDGINPRCKELLDQDSAKLAELLGDGECEKQYCAQGMNLVQVGQHCLCVPSGAIGGLTDPACMSINCGDRICTCDAPGSCGCASVPLEELGQTPMRR